MPVTVGLNFFFKISCNKIQQKERLGLPLWSERCHLVLMVTNKDRRGVGAAFQVSEYSGKSLSLLEPQFTCT